VPWISCPITYVAGLLSVGHQVAGDSSELQRVAVLLRQASTERSLPADYRDAARYWAEDLLGRMCPTAVPRSREGETVDARWQRHRLGVPIWVMAVAIYWMSFRLSW
jgi:hypothetical protein